MVVVDASVWVSRLLAEDVNHRVSHRWLEQLFFREEWVAAPIILLAEVAGALTRRTGQVDIGRYAIHHLLQIPTLRLVPLTQELGLMAAQTAATLQIGGADATYVAVAHHMNASLVTWDKNVVSKAGKVMKVYTPQP
jgi:predicted nucleic acid-binding protein